MQCWGVNAGDYVMLRPLMGGVFISKATVAPQVKAEDVLRQLVISLGKEAEMRGVREDEDLDAIIEDVQQRAYKERYGDGLDKRGAVRHRTPPMD